MSGHTLLQLCWAICCCALAIASGEPLWLVGVASSIAAIIVERVLW